MVAGASAEPQAQGAPSASIDLRRLHPLDAARLGEIAVTFARCGVMVVVRRGPVIVLQPRRRTPRAMAVAVRRSLADLGPTFIKLGQLIASSPGLFPATLSEELRKLLDDVPPEPPANVRRIIEHDLGHKVRHLFRHFDDEPIAAASIAQVHRAVLHDGTVVAVKIRRPRLRRVIERDLRLLALLATTLEHMGPLGTIVNPRAIVDDFADTLRVELDFRNEAVAMERFEANLRAFGDNGRVVVPAPVAGMVSRRVLVMTFVEGTTIDAVDHLRAQGHDLEDVLRCAIRAWVEAALVHGHFHGDVHAGNLLVTPSGEVAMLDFGIVGHLDERVRDALREALPALLIERDFERTVRAIFELGIVRRPIDVSAASRDLDALVTPLLARGLSDIDYAEVLGQVLRVATRYGVRLPKELVLVIKQLLYFERYSKALAPDYAVLADPQILLHLVGSLTARQR
jgi:predicted unusual protein kinase regulating ubiquinone biosynthesis (AarF/ABC1/UbiB family)